MMNLEIKKLFLDKREIDPHSFKTERDLSFHMNFLQLTSLYFYFCAGSIF